MIAANVNFLIMRILHPRFGRAPLKTLISSAVADVPGGMVSGVVTSGVPFQSWTDDDATD
jgi:hypothetical protein